jgi:hypothetical protein
MAKFCETIRVKEFSIHFCLTLPDIYVNSTRPLLVLDNREAQCNGLTIP